MATPVHPVIKALGMTQEEVGHLMGYRHSAVSQAFREGRATPSFRDAFLEMMGDQLFGPRESSEMFLSAPLIAYIRRACGGRTPRGWCLSQGLPWDWLSRTDSITLATADRVCGILKIHMSEIWHAA